MSVCLSVRMKAEISETIKATKLGLGMQIIEVLLQFIEMCWFRQYLSIDQKSFPGPL